MKGGVTALLLGLMIAGPIVASVSKAKAVERGGSSVAATMKPSALREILVKGLKATRADQQEYIDQIVELVVQGDLPLSLVLTAYKWSRKRRIDYPFPYFVYAVNALAKHQAEDD